MNESEPNQRVTRPWIIATIAVLSVIAASFLGFRAFKVTANAKTQASQQSAQSELAQSNDNQSASAQSGDVTSNPEPTPVNIPLPTPPPGLYAGGHVGAQVTAFWFLDLWSYAFNTGDTQDFMQLCQDGDFCDRSAEDIQAMHEDSIVVEPLEITVVPDNSRSYPCHLISSGVQGICVQLSISQKSSVTHRIRQETSSHDYTTIESRKNDGGRDDNTFDIVLFLAQEDDSSFVVRNIEWLAPDQA